MDSGKYAKLSPPVRSHYDNWVKAQQENRPYMEIERSRSTPGTLLTCLWSEIPVPHTMYRCGDGESTRIYVGSAPPTEDCSSMNVPDTCDYSDDLYQIDTFMGV